jgi:hypothetical protein
VQRTQFTFYESFFKAITRIKKKQDRADAYDMICSYLLYGISPLDNLHSYNPVLLSVFEKLKPELEKERRRSVEGRRCAEYKAWRKSVFERDNYTCQMCGARGVKLNAHHIFPYAHFPEKRYDIKNGITLCIPCHQKWHKENKHGG